MKEEQKGVYLISGKSKEAVSDSPMLEVFRQKGIEVLFLRDPIDEYSFQQLKDYNDHKLICITKDNCKIDETEDDKAAFEARKGKFEKIRGIFKGINGEDY
jgi:molecular chaperone HtpG